MTPMMLPFMEPIHVLGSGSVGLLWASSIRSAFPSYPLAVLFRSHHKSNIQGKDIMVCMRQNGRPRMARVPVQFIGDENQNPIRNILLSTKAHQASEAVESLIPRFDSKNLRIMVLCNGALDVRESLFDTFTRYDIQRPQLVMCTTTNGVYQEDPDEDMFHLVHIGLGRTFLGGMPPIAQLWDQSGLNAKSIEENEMEVMLWRKLAANCVCNPLTALWNIPNGKLSDYPQFTSIREQVIKEVSQVGLSMYPYLHNEISPERLDSFLEQVIQDNLENRSSMFHDVNKRQRTEIDSLNGYIIRKGKELNIDTPANAELFHRVQEITSCYIEKS